MRLLKRMMMTTNILINFNIRDIYENVINFLTRNCVLFEIIMLSLFNDRFF
jgi:hypothetical protein